VDKEGHRCLADFAATLPEKRETTNKKQGKWFMDEPALPSYSVAEVQGFKAHPEL
jgi:cytochrome c oxidase subunit 3